MSESSEGRSAEVRKGLLVVGTALVAFAAIIHEKLHAVIEHAEELFELFLASEIGQRIDEVRRFVQEMFWE